MTCSRRLMRPTSLRPRRRSMTRIRSGLASIGRIGCGCSNAAARSRCSAHRGSVRSTAGVRPADAEPAGRVATSRRVARARCSTRRACRPSGNRRARSIRASGAARSMVSRAAARARASAAPRCAVTNQIQISFTSPAGPTPRDHVARWNAFLLAHPEAGDRVLEWCRAQRDAGERRIGIAKCWEALRGKLGRGVSLDNSWRRPCALWVVARDPSLAPFIPTKGGRR